MGRRRRGSNGPSDFGFERTLADAEEAERLDRGPQEGAVCACGAREFLLQAFLHVVDGEIDPAPVELEELTCPACGREYEAVEGEGGRILRGEFLGYVQDDEG